ncbi:MAG TPA: methyltransferase domain-containing protein, partial [Candidatus Eisenbacteria bacterium]
MSEFTRFEHEGWERAVGGYERGFLPLTRQAIEPLLDAAGVRAGTRLLDLACGPGELAAAGASRRAHVTGADFSESMLALARQRHPGLEFRLADAQALPYADGSFDAVTMAFLVGHLSEPERAFTEAYRVLAPGGRLAFAWWQGFDRAVPFGVVTQALREHGELDVGLPAGPPFDEFSEARHCAGALATAGLADVHVVEAPLVWVTDAAALWDTFLTGGVRTTALLRAQAPERLAKVREAVFDA